MSSFIAATFIIRYINKASIGSLKSDYVQVQIAIRVMEFHSSANSLSEAEDAIPFDELSAGKPSHSGLDTETPYDHVVRMMSRHSTFDGPRPEHQDEDEDD